MLATTTNPMPARPWRCRECRAQDDGPWAPDWVTGYFPARDPYDQCNGCGCLPPYGEQKIAALTQLKLELVRLRESAVVTLRVEALQRVGNPDAANDVTADLPRPSCRRDNTAGDPAGLPSSALLSLRAAAKRLGVSRTRTLVPAIDAGLVRTVGVGKRRRIPLDEFARIVREGFGEQAPRPRKHRSKRGRAEPFDAAEEAKAVLALNR